VHHFTDRLNAAVLARKSPLCVGLDPRWESLPRSLSTRLPDDLEGRAFAYTTFCCKALEIVAPFAAAVKPQSAFFEVLGASGHVALHSVIQKAHQLELLVILDAKRNDIATTAAAYAQAAFELLDADALTVNPYLGRDGIDPFLTLGRKLQRGIFVLVRTSNPGAALFQDLNTDQGKLHEVIAKSVSDWSKENLGSDGFGDVGAVVGATSPQELAVLRHSMPQVPFLVPGYGAQGASAQDCRAAFQPGGLGAIINSSRGILFPYQPGDAQWENKIHQAAQQAACELGAIAGLR
jgi:orotidine-5'-phosphate decarboxylase